MSDTPSLAHTLATTSQASPHRACFLLRVRPEKLAEYADVHQRVWDEMRQALSDAGWRHYSLFLDPDTGEVSPAGRTRTIEELLETCEADRVFFEESGGGVTLSGGEVLMQPAFAGRLLAGAKKMGIHTCIDTSGFLGANASDEMLDNIDLVLLDVKSGDEETYKKVTGRSLAPTITFGDRLAAKGIEIWARFVLVPDLTDGPENVHNVARIIERWGSVSRVEVLPFHQMGTDKWDALGLTYQLRDTRPPEPELVESVRAIFRSYGFEVH